MPPPLPNDVFPLIVLALTVRLPPKFTMPPPW